MIIRAVYIGNSEEAYINKEFKEGLNIISMTIIKEKL